MTRRTQRIGEQLKGEISRILRDEVTDPRIGLLSVTRVDVAPDLSHAIVWWSAFGADAEADIQRIESGLESAAAFARRRLAEALPLKRTPALRFRHDPSLALGARTLSILRSLSDDPEA